MNDCKELSNFDFPKLSTSKVGAQIANSFLKSFLEGKKGLKRIYGNANKSKSEHHWYMHRFIFLQTFFNQGCVFKNVNTNEIIDSNIFDSLHDINVELITKNPRDRGEKIAAYVSKDIVTNLIKGESFVNSNYNEAEGIEEYKLRKQDHTGWLRQYYTFVDMMFEKGIVICVSTNNNTKNVDNIKIINSSRLPSCEELYIIKRQLLKQSESETIDTDHIYDEVENKHDIHLSKDMRNKFDDECF